MRRARRRLSTTRNYEEPIPGYALVWCGLRGGLDFEHVQISRLDRRPMSWKEIQRVFNAGRPGQWAVMTFPPADRLLDEANVYHLFVMRDEPAEFSL